jgi:hypothetical protein
MITKGTLVSHDQDGTLKAGAVDVAAVLATDVVETAKIKDLNVTTAKIADANVTSGKLAEAFIRGRLQSDTTNSDISGWRIQTGWGWVLGTAATAVSETLTFPTAFSSSPIVIATNLGYKVGSDPSSIIDFSVDSGENVVARPSSGSAASIMFVNKDSTVIATNKRCGYSWIAIGPA